MSSWRRPNAPPAQTTPARSCASASRPITGTLLRARRRPSARCPTAQRGTHAPTKCSTTCISSARSIHSSWALTTSAGIIVIDTLFDYAVEPEIVDGLTALGLDPKDIKYVLISHAHGDHDQGAAMLQSRYGAKVVMGAADWESTLQRPASAPGGVPKRDIAVGPEGLKIMLGDTTVDVIATPGHTPGTLSYLFPVKDGNRTLTVAYSGGTAFNFPRLAENFAIYRDSAKKMGAAASAAGGDHRHEQPHANSTAPGIAPESRSYRAPRAKSTRTRSARTPCSTTSR